MSAAPALLRWIRSRHPGVSRRQRSSSAGADGRDGEVRAVMSGKVAGTPVGLKPPRLRLKPRLDIPAEAACPYGQCRAAGLLADPPGLEEIAHHKPDIRRSLGQPPHVPREPVRPVTDQDPHRHALVLERALLGGADAVQHVYLVRPPSPP